MNLPKAPAAARGRVSLPIIQPSPLVVEHVSASQVKSYQACPRQWWWDKVAKVPRPARPHLDFGTEVHGHLENWLNHGTEPPASTAGSVARGGLHLIPAPRTPGVQVETDLDPALDIIPGVRWAGRMDVYAPPGVTGPAAWVLDHKTTKDWRWMKRPGELSQDPQVVSYALWSMRTHGGDAVRVSHVYYHTRPQTLAAGSPVARRVDTEVTLDGALDLWAEYGQTVRALVAHGLVTNPSDVPANLDACGQYGGCQYRERCANVSQNPPPRMSLGSALAARAPAPQAPVQAPPPEPPAAPPADGLVLYLGCVPVSGPHAAVAKPLESLVADYGAPICEAQNVVDLRLVPYAQGKGLLAGALRACPPRGVYYGATSGELNAVAVEALTPLADTIVRAVT